MRSRDIPGRKLRGGAVLASASSAAIGRMIRPACTDLVVMNHDQVSARGLAYTS